MKTRVPNPGLSLKEVRFLEHYLVHGSGSEAYRYAYSPKTASPETVARQAKTILRREPVAALIRAARKEAEQHARIIVAGHAPTALPMVQDYVASKERIAAKMSMLAFSDARDLFEWGPDGVKVKHSDDLTAAQAFAVVEVSQTITKDGGTIRVKLADKRQALMDLARLQGLLDPGAEEPPGGKPPDEAMRKQVRQQLLAALRDLAKPEPLTIEGRPEPMFEG